MDSTFCGVGMRKEGRIARVFSAGDPCVGGKSGCLLGSFFLESSFFDSSFLFFSDMYNTSFAPLMALPN
jgi:hypothetical protein